MRYIIGIDGGGTSTIAVISSADGNIVAKSNSGPSNPNTTQKVMLMQTYKELFTNLREQVHPDIWNNIIHIFAGVSGADHDGMKVIIHDVIEEVYGNSSKITIDNDAITALYSGTMGEYGIVQICGTGSVTFGLNSAGLRGRVGGWGHFITENCGGYYIGKAGLEAAFDFYDRVGEQTLLVEKFVEYFQVENLPEIVPDIYHSPNPKRLIANLAKLVFQTAGEGDIVAKHILEQTGSNIGESIIGLTKRLFTEEECKHGIQVVLVGSIFKQLSVLEPGMRSKLQTVSYPIKYSLPKYEPVIGAIFCGMKEENIDINQSVIEAIKHTY